MWKQIKDYNYEVSEEGQVRNIKTEKILKPSCNTDGYHQYSLRYNGKQYSSRAHRLIAEAFIPNPLNKKEIDHIDRNKTNNNICNLRWADRCIQNQNKQCVTTAKHIYLTKKGLYYVKYTRNKIVYANQYKKLEDAEAYLEELKSTIIINGIE